LRPSSVSTVPSKLVAVVPARGGSKRYPGKNLAAFMGKPLIAHTLDALAPLADTLIVASDSHKILEAAQARNQSVTPHLLNSETTGDTNTVLESLNGMLDTSLARWVDRSDVVLGLFLPTAPLRTTDHVREALALLVPDLDGVVSITDYEFPPQLNVVIGPDGQLQPAPPFLTGHTRSQDYKEIWRPNGAIYLHWGPQFMRHRNFFQGRVHGYYMPRELSVDIDTEADARLAELRLRAATPPT
jgi:CMP-N,N'-diacetyllegionaminic acid synthase